MLIPLLYFGLAVVFLGTHHPIVPWGKKMFGRLRALCLALDGGISFHIS